MGDSALLPAITGLAGAVIGAGLAQFRWVRDRADVRRGPYEEKRREAYDGLWRVVQQAHVAARLDAPQSPATERKLLAEVNTFAMVNGAYLDSEDRRLASEYIAGVLTLLDQLEKADRPEYRDMRLSTAAFPPDFGPNLQELSVAAADAERLRAKLRDKVRNVMSIDGS
jgi:hypothetical protein